MCGSKAAASTTSSTSFQLENILKSTTQCVQGLIAFVQEPTGSTTSSTILFLMCRKHGHELNAPRVWVLLPRIKWSFWKAAIKLMQSAQPVVIKQSSSYKIEYYWLLILNKGRQWSNQGLIKSSQYSAPPLSADFWGHSPPPQKERRWPPSTLLPRAPSQSLGIRADSHDLNVNLIECSQWWLYRLTYFNLTEVYELHDHLEIFEFDALQVDQGMLVPVLQKNFPEERAARAQDHFVRAELLVALASQRHVGEVLVGEQTLEGRPGTGFELVPSQVEVLWVGHCRAKFWRERS